MISDRGANSPKWWRLALAGALTAVIARSVVTTMNLEAGAPAAFALGGIGFAGVGYTLGWTIVRSVPASPAHRRRISALAALGGFVFGVLSADRDTFFWGVTALVVSLSIAVRPLERSWRVFLFVFAGWMAGVIPLALLQILMLLAGAAPDQLLVGRAAFEILSYGVIFYFVNAALLLAFPRPSLVQT